MSHRLSPPLLLCAGLVAGCASQDVVVRHEPTPDVALAAYESYHLVVPPSRQGSSTHWMVQKAIHDDLRAKGYVPVDRASANSGRQLPVWRGTAEGDVHAGRLTASVKDALAEILAGIPGRS